jgi:Putative transcriptional repressor regulating G2/M transition
MIYEIVNYVLQNSKVLSVISGWLKAGVSGFGLTTCLKCPACPRVFVNKFNLKVHIRDVHSADRGPFSCSQCGKQVKNQSCLRVHIYQQHRKKSSPSNSHIKREEMFDNSGD